MAPAFANRGPLRGEPGWPVAEGRRPVFLLDASSPLERRLLEAWIERNRPPEIAAGSCDIVNIPPTRRRSRRVSIGPLEECLASGADAMLAPLRVAWLPRKRGGVRAVRLPDLLRFGDPRDPGRLRQRWILHRESDRGRIVAGEAAPAWELRKRWRDAGGHDIEQTTGLA